MALTDIITGLAGAVAEANQSLSRIDGQIAELEAERRQMAEAQVHTDDIIAVFVRGLDMAEEDYLKSLGWYLNNKNLAQGHRAEAVAAARVGDGNQVLALPARQPGENYTRGLFPPTGRNATVDLDMTLLPALHYFMRPLIEEQLPELVNRLCPAAQDGTRQADRDQELARIDSGLLALFDERAELVHNLEAARAAAGQPASAANG